MTFQQDNVGYNLFSLSISEIKTYTEKKKPKDFDYYFESNQPLITTKLLAYQN